MSRSASQETGAPYSAVISSARSGIRVTLFGVVASAVLASVKILAGIFGHSYALIADGLESMLDIVSSLVVCWSLKIASIPPDGKHPYGHGKAEPLGALVVAVGLLAAGAGIAVQSVREILTPHHAPAGFTLIVLIAVFVTKEAMFRRLVKTGESIGSDAMKIDAWHHRSDALTSAAAFLGISVALIAGKGYESADDWAALFACAVIAYNGVRLFRSALDEAMDAAAPPEVEGRVRSVAAAVEGVTEIEKCRVRKSGLSFFVEIHAVVSGDLTVRRGHSIAHEVKDSLLRSDIGVVDVAVHIEPVEE